MTIRTSSLTAVVLAVVLEGSAQAQIWSWRKLPDPRGEFVRVSAPHLVGHWAHPRSVCLRLHNHAVAAVQDSGLREALLLGISETGDGVPAPKQAEISAAFSQIAKPTLQCMFEPAR